MTGAPSTEAIGGPAPRAQGVRRSGGPTAIVAIIGLVLAVVAGGFGGAWLGERASEPGTEHLLIEDPASALGSDAASLRSDGGFTGFGGLPALPGEVLRPGVVGSVTDGLIEVSTDTATVRVRYTSPDRLFRLGTAGRAPEVGDTVVLQLSDGIVTSALIVPADIEEGIGAGG